MYSIPDLRKCVRRGYVVLKLYMALVHSVPMHRHYYMAISAICAFTGIVLFVVGTSNIPSRPPVKMVGDVTTGTMSDSDYSSLVTRSAAFAEMISGLVIFLFGGLLHMYRVDMKEERLPDGAVAPVAVPVSILKKEVRFEPQLTP